MRKSLLICIAFHYVPDRIKYLLEVLDSFVLEYNIDLYIIIDTNSPVKIEGLKHFLYKDKIKVVVHKDLKHPFHLTWCHRKHIKDNIDNYDNFMYIEDDIYLPFENYLNYLENFKILYPKYVPGFVRIEKKEAFKFISDVPKKQIREEVGIGGKQFHSFPFPINYHAFWIMPSKELKESMKDNFVQYTDGREFAAMYVGWELGKSVMVELENGLISNKCYSYHLPNNYALSEGHPNGKIKIQEVFI